MLILNPREVTFASAVWTDVTLISLNRRGTKVVLDWTDDGPHPTFADVPEQRTDVRIVMEVARGEVSGPRPGEAGTLTFITGPGASDAGRRRLTLSIVITAVEHELSDRKGAVRTIDAVALSSDAATDPVSVANVE